MPRYRPLTLGACMALADGARARPNRQVRPRARAAGRRTVLLFRLLRRFETVQQLRVPGELLEHAHDLSGPEPRPQQSPVGRRQILILLKQPLPRRGPVLAPDPLLD